MNKATIADRGIPHWVLFRALQTSSGISDNSGISDLGLSRCFGVVEVKNPCGYCHLPELSDFPYLPYLSISTGGGSCNSRSMNTIANAQWGLHD